MKKFKKIVVCGLSLCLCMTMFLSCGNSNTESNESEKPYIAMISKGFQHQYWQVVKRGANDAANDFDVNITFDGPPSESDINLQVDMLKNALERQPVAICLAALDTSAVTDQLNEAKNKNIPVIGFDSGIPNAPTGSVAANASTDNFKAAELAADELFKNEKFLTEVTKGTEKNPVVIGILSQDAVSDSIKKRTSGFIENIVKKIETLDGMKGAVEVTGHEQFNKPSKNVAKVSVQIKVPVSAAVSDMKKSAQELFAANHIIALYATNENAVTGVLSATNDGSDLDRTNGKYKNVLVVGFDAGKGQKTAVQNGWFLGSVTQDPYQIGYKAVELAYKSYKKEVVNNVDTGAKWYNKQNLGNPEISELVYD